MPIIANFAFFGTIIDLRIGAIDAKLGFWSRQIAITQRLNIFPAFLIAQTRLRTVKLAPPSGKQDSMKRPLQKAGSSLKPFRRLRGRPWECWPPEV
ncbi:MAG: hypothetical protein IPO22_16150 [Anaerolineales bacterium]|nr:hypothetical protein [Anaerolineales bacterium]